MGAKNAITEKPTVFDYHSYRDFLSDWFAYKKNKQASFSMRKFASQAGFSVAYLSMVISGKRSLNQKALEKLQKQLKLSEAEFSYLSCLHILSDSNSQEKRLKAIDKMQSFNRYKNNHSTEARFYSYLSQWYNVAIKEMSELDSFTLNIKSIQQRLIANLSPKEIRKSLDFLLKERFLIPDGKGGFKAGDPKIKCEGSIFKSGLASFHKQMFNKAIEAIDNTPGSKRWIYGNTLALSKTQFEKAKKIMQDANEAINEVQAMEDSEGKVVYHTGFVAFPLTQSPEND